MPKRKKSVRRITAAHKEQLNRLADILYEFLPLTARATNAVTFISIFKESSAHKYLEGPENKRQVLQKGLTKVYKYHRNLPKTIIRKVIPAAIEYRDYMRNPLTGRELNELVDCLKRLDIDMENEINQVEIDERLPRITVPPKKLTERLRGHDLDEALSSEPLKLFEDGHFNEAVRKATEKFEDIVQEHSNISSSGKDLMARAFTNANLIDLSGIEPENQTGFTEGYKFLSMGLMAAIRNVFSHGDEQRRSPEECFEMLLLVNWLMRYLKGKHG
jgi:uncharacterized protein (TIGR02391 family)